MLEPGGSGNGVTNALKRMKCPRSVYYSDMYEEARTKSGAPKLVGTNGSLIGTLCHAYAEMYSQGHEFEPVDVEFLCPEGYTFPDDFGDLHVEAARIFDAFKKKFRPGFGGTLLHAEKFFEYENDVNPAKPLTARIDAIFRFDSTLNDLGVDPGTYIVDYKFLSQFGPKSVDEYRYSAQAGWYKFIAKHYGLPIDAVVFVIGVRNTKPRFEIVRAEEMDAGALAHLIAQMKAETDLTVRTFNCSSKYGSCPHMSICLGASNVESTNQP
jgi:hypothetical protein